ncbi:MAG: hypothetical protein MUO40_05035, partial [Anaerolineaceae bacterium]|nr:hypothetical protein [Anaerolineaceae bacterium]
DDIIPRIGAYIILCRLRNIILECIKSIRKGQVRISMTLMKIIVEDSAVAYIHFKDKLETITNLDPTKCISRLKKDISTTGRFYGMVNMINHFNDALLKSETEIISTIRNKKTINAKINTKIHSEYKDTETRIWILLYLYSQLHEFYWSLFDLVLSNTKNGYKYWTIDEKGSLNYQLPKDVFGYFKNSINKLRLLTIQST